MKTFLFVFLVMWPCVAHAEEQVSLEILAEPSDAFELQESGGFGFYGSELASLSVMPLDEVRKMHPQSKDKVLVRITRTGGWSRDSFLIVPQQRARAFLLIWHTGRWNKELDVVETIIRTTWVQDSKDFEEILEAKLLSDPKAIQKLDAGKAGDDSPFLLVERIGPKGYNGAIVPPTYFNGRIDAEAEAALDALEKIFTEPANREANKKIQAEAVRNSMKKLFPEQADDDAAEQDGAGQPATRYESDSEGRDKPKPESDGRSR